MKSSRYWNEKAFPLRALAAGILCLVLAVAFTVPVAGSPANSLAAIAPGLGAAATFAVLGASAVTNTGDTTVHGNLGIWPNTASSITGFPPGGVVAPYTTYAGDAVAQQAQSDVTTAYNALASQPCDSGPSAPGDLGGLTLAPGVYCYSSSVGLTGALTLDAEGDPAAVWVFKIGSTLTTASDSSVTVINGGSACNVFWQVGSSATLGARTDFVGSILALSSISLNDEVIVLGRLLARNGAVTLINDDISFGNCVPTAVFLELFAAEPSGEGILVRWETASESANLGFNVLRAEPEDGARSKLNQVLIPSRMAPGSPVGATYEFADGTPELGVTYDYWLEAVDIYGQVETYGPVSAGVLTMVIDPGLWTMPGGALEQGE